MSDVNLRAAQMAHLMVDSVLNGTVLPDRLITAQLVCGHLENDPDSTDGVPCGWSGMVDVAVFDDTREALWWCPENHENAERYGDYS